MAKQTTPWDFRHIQKYNSITSEHKELHAEFNLIDDSVGKLVDMHFELELGIVLEGRLKRQYDRTEVVLEPGDVWLTNIWEPHGYHLEAGPCKILLFLIHPQLLKEINIGRDLSLDWFAPFLASPESRPGRLSKKIRKELIQLAEAAGDILPLELEIDQLKLRLNLLQILTAIHSEWSSEGDAPHYLSRYSMISPAIEALYSSREFISTEEAASRCGLGLTAFKKAFKELMSQTFSQFSASYRVKGAASQLIHTSDPLKQIVADWGFTDESHLHRAFVKAFEMSPGKYRQQMSR